MHVQINNYMPSFSCYIHHFPLCFFLADVHSGLHGILMYSFCNLYNCFLADGLRLFSYLLLQTLL